MSGSVVCVSCYEYVSYEKRVVKLSDDMSYDVWMSKTNILILLMKMLVEEVETGPAQQGIVCLFVGPNSGI